MFLNSVRKAYSQHILKQLQAILINTNVFAVIVRRLQKFASIRIEYGKRRNAENKLIEQVLANIRKKRNTGNTVYAYKTYASCCCFICNAFVKFATAFFLSIL